MNRDLREIEKGYRKIQQEYAVNEQEIGIIKMSGNDVLDFLHRTTTNEVRNITIGGSIDTIFTSEKGKIVDVVTLCSQTDSFLIICNYSNRFILKDWITRFIITEDITIDDVTTDYCKWLIVGREAESVVSGLPDIVQNIPDQASPSALPWVLFPGPFSNQSSFQLLVPVSHPLNEHTIFKTQAVPPDSVELLRIEEGRPAWGHEITGDVNPLETGLQGLVSFDKGCYIGQEVIARIHTYQKLQRRLSGFIFDTGTTGSCTDAAIYDNDTIVGRLTSDAFSFSLGRHIGIGLVKNSITSGSFLVKNSMTSSMVTMTSLPFIKAENGR